MTSSGVGGDGRIRVAHLIETDGPGGAERAVVHLARAFQSDVASSVVFLPVNGEWPPSRSPGVPRGATIRYGVPFRVPDRVDGRRVTPEEATRLLMLRIAELMPPRYRGPYAAWLG